jgi:hypothetical protein
MGLSNVLERVNRWLAPAEIEEAEREEQTPEERER